MEYIETIVLINVGIHLIFVRISCMILGIRTKPILLILSCGLDIVYTILYLTIPYKIELFRYLFVFLISVFPFLEYKMGSVAGFVLYLIFNMTVGGINEILYVANKYSMLVLFLSVVGIAFIGVTFSIKTKTFHHNQLYFLVRVTNKKKRYYIKAYLDTGNLLNYELIPIVLVKKKEMLGSFYKEIQINGAINGSKLMLYKVDRFEICIHGKYYKRDVYLAHAVTCFDALIGLKIIGG